ncbi:MAG: DUF262 domain-containing protein [Deferribacteraceae bacterium]|nr:DUF262 domain-containing protein [Deferribacteraceae bacterium]
MAGFQAPITIHQAIDRIRKKEYLLPAFQREFVWKPWQIEQLFDSLMQGYPISSMLFWKVKGVTKTDFRFYQFLDTFVEAHKVHNDLMATDSINDFHAILDGQQRLTALHIGLCGSYASKEKYLPWVYSEKNFPTKHLYLDISKTYSEESNKKFMFSFIDKIKTKEEDLYYDHNSHVWFRVGRILSLHQEEYDLDDFAEDNSLSKDSKKMLKRLDKAMFTDLNINYYEEDEQNPDKAVNIFVRINSGGTALSYSDILFSIAVANWKQKDARTEINGLVDSVNSKGFTLNKDYILKAFLFLHHKDIRYNIINFNSEFVAKIEQQWESIRDAVTSLFDLLKTFGLTSYTLTSYNATLPILYYLYHKNIYTDFATKITWKEDRIAIKNWLLTVLLRRIFGANSDTSLMQARNTFTKDINAEFLQSTTNFPASAINSGIKRMTDIGDEFIAELLTTQKDNSYSFSILAMLYPDLDYKNNNFQQDHLHPASTYNKLKQEDKDGYGWVVFNSILNLQMLDANENMSKQDQALNDWVSQQTKGKDKDKFLANHLIPNVNLDLNNFGDFIEARKVLLMEKLKVILNT